MLIINSIRKFAGIIVFLIILAAIPVTVFLSQRPQPLNPKAATKISICDLDRNGKENGLDYEIIVNCIHKNELCTVFEKAKADLNIDDVVDEVDLNIFLKSCNTP